MASNRSIELRVGIFVLVGLAVIAGLILRFSKQAGGVKNPYRVTVLFPTVSGLVPDASVQYAGIGVGKVEAIRLQEDHQWPVALTLAIKEGVVIRQDATFAINTSGLLGDKYVDVQPGTTGAAEVKDGDVLKGLPSVDLNEAVAHVRDVLQKVGPTIERVDQALRRLETTVLSEESLGHVTATLANVDTASTNAVELVSSLRDLVAEQRGEVALAIRNVQAASSNLTLTAEQVGALVESNAPQIGQTVSNLVSGTERIDTLLAGLQRGEGTAGRLLVDPTLHDEVVRLVQNWRRYGLLYKEGNRPSAKATRGGRTPVPARPAGDSGDQIEFGTDMTN